MYLNTQEQIRDYLKPAGKQVISFVEEDIEILSTHIEVDEQIISATTSSKKLTYFLFLLTTKRLITLEKDKKGKSFVSYDVNATSNLVVNRKLFAVEVDFTYLKNEIKLKLTNDNATKTFANELENIFGIPEKALPHSSIVGWTVIGSKFDNAGAIAGAMGANIGKDKSVATLFLKHENGEKVPLVIKCDKKDLEKLSLC